MKVIALVILVVGSTSGLGSGPYLPRGWRPKGPAFDLPTEVEQTPAPVPLKAVPLENTEAVTLNVQEAAQDAAQIQVESEASGSDAFREYGPPKNQEVSQDLTQQDLPDSITEQAFVVIETKSETQSEVNAEISQEANTEIENQTESSLTDEEETTEKLLVVTEAEQTAEAPEVEMSQQDTNDSNVDIVEQKSEERAELKAVETGIENIADALVNLENEIIAQQVQTKEELTEVKFDVQGSTQNGPEGFLEYGPPGFTEYGPPKGDLKSVAEGAIAPSNEISDARRRRFSPRFKATKQSKHVSPKRRN